jgi:hypothetical protein
MIPTLVPTNGASSVASVPRFHARKDVSRVAMLTLTESCEKAPPPIADSFGHRYVIRPDSGFEIQWTRREKEYMAEQNRNAPADCNSDARGRVGAV